MGKVKYSTIENYECEQFQIQGIKMQYKKREFRGQNTSKNTSTLKNHSLDDPLSKSYNEYIEEKQPLLYKNETVTSYEKSFDGQVHLTKDFPISLNELIPIIEILSPSSRKYEYLINIINQLPEGYFPVKLDVPIFPTVSAEITFQNFDTNSEIDPGIFKIPDWVTRK